MKAETRLKRALARSVIAMTEAANTLHIEGTNYESEPLDERFKDGLRILQKGVRDGERVLRGIREAESRVPPVPSVMPNAMPMNPADGEWKP